MSLLKYLKQKWLTYLFILLSYLFAYAVYKLDHSLHLSQSNAIYISTILLILLIGYMIVDYFILYNRTKQFREFAQSNFMDADVDSFFYPIDRTHAQAAQTITQEFEEYKADIYNRSAQELEFITRWVHDIKVPISALRLMLESKEQDIPPTLYQKMDMEINSIETDTQTVLYHMKYHSFYDDFKLTQTHASTLISAALIDYSTFFSYKHITLEMPESDHYVITDSKWSQYILSQILSNAVKHTPVYGTITIDVSSRKTEVMISIRNSGNGIHPDDIHHIFDKGYTSSGNRGSSRATGYGMYLSKQLANKLGHTLKVTSVMGEYAQFSLTFMDNMARIHMTKV